MASAFNGPAGVVSCTELNAAAVLPRGVPPPGLQDHVAKRFEPCTRACFVYFEIVRLARVASCLMTVFLVACNGCAGSRSAPSMASPSIAVIGAMRTVIFQGMCDASGAVSISDRTFAVADDEDNVLRVYDADRGGLPISAVDVSDDLDLRRKRGRKVQKALARAPETDIEGATRLGDRAVWITSHGRSSSGKHRPERLRFFATPLPDASNRVRLVGAPYSQLLEELAADPRMAPFDLPMAATLAPKSPGGLNIEGLTATPDGRLLIGFRNPLPNNRALVIQMENPDEVFGGGAARFGDPQLLDLAGLGSRGGRKQ